MKISHKDAISILGSQISATQSDIKKAYRRACSMYHPDKNPAGLEMMKIINLAYESLKDYVAKEEDGKGHTNEQNYGDDLNNALNSIIGLGLHIEICGAWVWVGGDTKKHKETLKENGFKWAPKKMMWYFRPDNYKSFGRGKFSMDEIRERHGSIYIKEKPLRQISSI